MVLVFYFLNRGESASKKEEENQIRGAKNGRDYSSQSSQNRILLGWTLSWIQENDTREEDRVRVVEKKVKDTSTSASKIINEAMQTNINYP